jgi:hypothetical protein
VQPEDVVSQRQAGGQEHGRDGERLLAFEPVQNWQPAQRGQCHQNPHQHFDEPQPACGHAVVWAQELVGQQQVRGMVVVGQQQRDHDPRHRRPGDPGDGIAQVPHPDCSGHRREAGPAEVVSRDAQQQMRAAPQLEQPGMRTDDKQNRDGAHSDAGLQRRIQKRPPPPRRFGHGL